MYEAMTYHLSFIRRHVRQHALANCAIAYRHYGRTRRQLKERLGPLVDKYYTGNPQNTVDASKFLNLQVWTLETLTRVIRLNLHQTKGQRVLDIGTGCGYFPYLCRQFGHDAECVDLDTEPLYNESVAALGLKRHVRRIQQFESLDIEGKFDLITAFMICFNEHKQPGLWHIDEWKYFVTDMEVRLNPGGAIYLSFNTETPTEPVSRELLRYFESRGARVQESDVLLFKR